MLIATIPYNDYAAAKEQICAIAHKIDGVELRLDYAENLDLKKLTTLRQALSVPVIFTLRQALQGGYYRKTEAERLADLSSLCTLAPDYLDIEYDVDPAFFKKVKNTFPHIKIICSYHNLQETPADLMAIFQQMRRHDCYGYKLVTFSQSTTDALRILNFVQNTAVNHRITGIAMGELGQCTRILSPVMGNFFTYAAVTNATTTAPGQITIDELITTYRYRHLIAGA